jgi:tetratricopeptide (TPR) repeat protein
LWHGVALVEDAGVEGGWALAERIAAEALAEGRNRQLDWLQAQFSVNRAIAEGRLDDAGEGIGRVLALAPDDASDDPQMAAAYSAFLIARERDQLDLLEGVVAEQLEVIDRAPGLAALRMVVGLALVALGRETEAAEQLAALGPDFAGLPADSTWSLGASHATDLIVELDDRDRAAALYEHARSLGAERLCVVAAGAGMLGAMDRYLGLLAETRGDPSAARAHYERAIEVNERKDGPLEAAHARVDLARVLGRDGGSAEAGRLLEATLAFAGERDGLARLRRRAMQASAVTGAVPR